MSPPSTSRPSTPRTHSRSNSQHHPSTPSRLKHSHAPGTSPQDDPPSPPFQTPASRFPQPLNPFNYNQRTDPVEENSRPAPSSPSLFRPRHWRNYSTHNCSQAEGEPCEHGSFSPRVRPTSPTSTSSLLDEDSNSDHGFGGRYARGQSIVGGVNGVLGDAVGDTVFGDGNIFSAPSGYDGAEDGKRARWSDSWSRWWEGGGDDKSGGKKTMSTTRWLATKHGVRNKRSMYVSISPWETGIEPICPFACPFASDHWVLCGWMLG